MSLSDHLPLADVKNRLSEVVDQVEREHARVVITKHGRPAAVVLSIDDLESLEETLAILSAPELVAGIREGAADVAAAAVELVYGGLAEAPRRPGEPLQFDFEGLLSARRGDYRVIYQVDDERRLITVVEVAHRRDAYRRG